MNIGHHGGMSNDQRQQAQPLVTLLRWAHTDPSLVEPRWDGGGSSSRHGASRRTICSSAAAANGLAAAATNDVVAWSSPTPR